MGMTIEEHKEHLLDIMDSMPDDACGDWRDSLAYAIDTMRKYQKIEQIAREQPTITEQDIVKPYLERLKRRMEARDDDNGGEPLNAVDRGYHLAYEHLCEEIANILKQMQEGEA